MVADINQDKLIRQNPMKWPLVGICELDFRIHPDHPNNTQITLATTHKQIQSFIAVPNKSRCLVLRESKVRMSMKCVCWSLWMRVVCFFKLILLPILKAFQCPKRHLIINNKYILIKLKYTQKKERKKSVAGLEATDLFLCNQQ